MVENLITNAFGDFLLELTDPTHLIIKAVNPKEDPKLEVGGEQFRLRLTYLKMRARLDSNGQWLVYDLSANYYRRISRSLSHGINDEVITERLRKQTREIISATLTAWWHGGAGRDLEAYYRKERLYQNNKRSQTLSRQLNQLKKLIAEDKQMLSIYVPSRQEKTEAKALKELLS